MYLNKISKLYGERRALITNRSTVASAVDNSNNE